MVPRDVVNWFAGGRQGYMTLVHCMNHDVVWISITVALDLTIAVGYVLIALHWRDNERELRDTPAKAALGTMKNIFIFCGLCGYVFIPIKMFWPAWRLYDMFLAVLAFYTWRYALRSRELKVVYNQLERTEKLSEDLEQAREEGRRQSYFLNAISHDIKTPLNGLLLQAELAELEMEDGDPVALREALEQIKLCARTTADLLNNFLEIGRLDWSPESVQAVEFLLSDAVATVLGRSGQRAAAKGLKLEVESRENLTVRSDRVRIERILCNLVDNAIKFCDEGGVRLVADLTAAGVAIHVVDTGEGIALEHQKRIFDDFVQLQNRERDSRKGFGLGLAIARRLAHQLGGHLAVESEPGRGSRFTLVLPAVAGQTGGRPDTDGGGSDRKPFLSPTGTPAAPPG